MSQKGPFVKDMEEIRRRAREQIEKGAVTRNYGGDVAKAIELLNGALATELVCVLRYKYHAIMATGLASESVRKEFAEHAREEEEHMDQIADRINQLGGKPDFHPDGLLARSASQYIEGETMVDMIREDLVAERIAIEHYRELVRYFGEQDPTTRLMLERILAKEEEHANDMHDLLAAHDDEYAARAKAAPEESARPHANGEGAARDVKPPRAQAASK